MKSIYPSSSCQQIMSGIDGGEMTAEVEQMLRDAYEALGGGEYTAEDIQAHFAKRRADGSTKG